MRTLRRETPSCSDGLRTIVPLGKRDLPHYYGRRLAKRHPGQTKGIGA